MTGEDEVETYDVLVVGAGPAGSRAAEAAARGGASTLLVESRDKVGEPVQCAEFIPRPLGSDLGLPSGIIAQEVSGTVTRVADSEPLLNRNPGYIIHRDRFDKLLAERAVEAGAEMRLLTKVLAPIRWDGDWVQAELEERAPVKRRFPVRARVVVGADGPMSTVGRSLGKVNQRLLKARQVTVALREPSDVTEVFLHPFYRGGYGWLFPKGKVANVGVGVDKALGGVSSEALAHLLGLLKGRIGATMVSTGGRIPVGGRLPARTDNCLLAGDAAGHTHPITGGGIHQAVESGRMAGEAAAGHVNGDEAALKRYAGEFESLFRVPLDRANEKRRTLESEWRDSEEDPLAFIRLMRRTWISFPEYYKGRGV